MFLVCIRRDALTQAGEASADLFESIEIFFCGKSSIASIYTRVNLYRKIVVRERVSLYCSG
jgi:hypothetical protein